MTPIHANIVGPPNSTTSNRLFLRGLPFGSVVLRLRKLGDVGAGVLQGDKVATAGQLYRIVERVVSNC
jgi:hypothetical protein